MRIFYGLLLLFFLNSCAGTKPYYGDNLDLTYQRPGLQQPAYTLYLIGDAGKPFQGEKDTLHEELKAELQRTGKAGAILFLGDNIYPKGLPAEGSTARQAAEDAMDYQLDICEGYEGRVIFLPGNHDWNLSSKGGWEAVKRQERYVQEKLDRTYDTYLPDSGCPGPAVVPLQSNTTLLVLDTEWWLFKFEKPQGKGNICGVENDSAFLSGLKQALDENKGKNIIVAAHHPLYSNGNHGGRFGMVDHLFPVTNVVKHLYIPLPVLGSAYVWARQGGVLRQDIPNRRYSALRDSMEKMFEAHPGLIYVAGHEHNLQYKRHDGRHYIVSGSGSKTSYAARKGADVFAQKARGYVKIEFYPDGTRVMTVRAENGNKMGTVLQVPLK